MVESLSELDFGGICGEHGVAVIKDFSVPVLSFGEDGVVVNGGGGVGKVGSELVSLEGERVSSLSGESVD